MSQFGLVHIVALLGAVVTVVDAQTLEPLGFVDSVTGAWELTRVGQPARKLAKGDNVFAGSSVGSRDSAPTSRIKIARYDGTIFVCPSDTCKGTKRLDSEAKPDLPLIKRISVFFDRSRALPTIFTVARSASASGPRPSVLVVQNGMVNLTPAVARLDPGNYLVRLVPQDASVSEPPAFPLNWNNGSASIHHLISPGLYALEVSTTGQQPVGTPTAALLLPPEQAKKAQEIFAQAESIVTKWGGDVDSGLVTRFLNQALFAIAANP